MLAQLQRIVDGHLGGQPYSAAQRLAVDLGHRQRLDDVQRSLVVVEKVVVGAEVVPQAVLAVEPR